MRFLRFILVLALSLFSIVVYAESKPLPLWEATGPQGTLYLFGSIHICNTSCFPLPEAAMKRLDSSDALVVELDPKRPELQGKFLKAAMLPAEQNLQKLVSASDWKALIETTGEMGLPPDTLLHMRPWLANFMLTIAVAQKAGFDPAQGIDLAFMKLAAEHELPLEELESVDEQINAINAGTTKEQSESLHLTLDMIHSDSLAGYLQNLLQAWQSGSATQIDKLLRQSMPKNSALTRAIFDDRNIRMAERLQQNMQDGHTRFVVVGAGHLVGKQGIPALLAKHGYQVRQLHTDD